MACFTAVGMKISILKVSDSFGNPSKSSFSRLLAFDKNSPLRILFAQEIYECHAIGGSRQLFIPLQSPWMAKS